MSFEEVVAIERVGVEKRRSTSISGTEVAQVSMWAVLLLGVLGVVWTFTFPPAWALVKSDTWAIDLWCLSGVAIAVAGLIASISVRHLACPLVVLAGVAVSVCAALAADPNAQGPGFDVVAMLCDLASIGCAIAILGRSDLKALAKG